MESIKTSQELYEHVMSEYKKYDTELNSLFFDFPVHMSKSDILVTYEHLQHDINGDYVVRLKIQNRRFWTMKILSYMVTVKSH